MKLWKNLKNNISQIFRNRGTVEILIQSVKKIHVFLIDCEIKDPCVRSNAFRMNRFWNDRNSLLHSPAKTYLCGCVRIFSTEHTENIVVQISASCQRGVRLYLNAVSLTVFDELFWITERMTLDLVDCGFDRILCEVLRGGESQNY